MRFWFDMSCFKIIQLVPDNYLFSYRAFVPVTEQNKITETYRIEKVSSSYLFKFLCCGYNSLFFCFQFFLFMYNLLLLLSYLFFNFFRNNNFNCINVCWN